MKQTKWICDRCKQEITGTAYILTCYAEDVEPSPLGGQRMDTATQNMAQNMAVGERHLCRACKDEVTDGVFIV